MTRYYIIHHNNEKGFDEVTQAEFFAVIGDDTHRPYADKVYSGEILLEDVPEEYRATVATIVANRTAKFGQYKETDIPIEAEIENNYF